MSERQKQLLKLLRGSKPGLSVEELSKALEITRNAVRQHLATLEVGGLVLADRHKGRLVDHDVRGLQHRVGQESVVDVVRLELLLLLVGRRALRPLVLERPRSGWDDSAARSRACGSRPRTLPKRADSGAVPGWWRECA